MSQTNVDQEEINKFDNIAADWWNPNGKMKPLHQLNPLRLEYIQKFTPLANKTILDVGCGGGLLSEAMAKQQAHVTAIDMSPSILEIAKQHAKTADLEIDYQQTTVEAFAAKQPEQFDIVTCMEMLEHVPDPASVIQACGQLLKPQGFFFISTLNRNITSYLKAIVAAEYVLGLLDKGTHQYKKFIRPSELRPWAQAVDLELEDLQGIEYKVLSQQFEFCKNVDVNYLACFQKQE